VSEPLQVGFILWMKGDDDLFYFLVFTIKILNLNFIYIYIYIYILSFYFMKDFHIISRELIT